MTEIVSRPKSSWLRYAVLGLIGVQVALFALFWADFLLRFQSMDMITRSMNRHLGLLFIVPMVLLTLPALFLAIWRRWLVLTLIFLLLWIVAVVGFIGLINFQSG